MMRNRSVDLDNYGLLGVTYCSYEFMSRNSHSTACQVCQREISRQLYINAYAIQLTYQAELARSSSKHKQIEQRLRQCYDGDASINMDGTLAACAGSRR
jgi:hypothetical protein